MWDSGEYIAHSLTARSQPVRFSCSRSEANVQLGFYVGIFKKLYGNALQSSQWIIAHITALLWRPFRSSRVCCMLEPGGAALCVSPPISRYSDKYDEETRNAIDGEMGPSDTDLTLSHQTVRVA